MATYGSQEWMAQQGYNNINNYYKPTYPAANAPAVPLTPDKPAMRKKPLSGALGKPEMQITQSPFLSFLQRLFGTQNIDPTGQYLPFDWDASKKPITYSPTQRSDIAVDPNFLAMNNYLSKYNIWGLQGGAPKKIGDTTWDYSRPPYVGAPQNTATTYTDTGETDDTSGDWNYPPYYPPPSPYPTYPNPGKDKGFAGSAPVYWRI